MTGCFTDVVGRKLPPDTRRRKFADRDGGTLARGTGVIGVSRVSAGVYRVAFDRVVRNCGFIAAVASTGTAPVADPALAFTSNTFRATDTVTVWTTQWQGHPADFPFHVAATCGRSTTQSWGVVDALGTPVGGARLLDTESLDTGLTNVTMQNDRQGLRLHRNARLRSSRLGQLARCR